MAGRLLTLGEFQPDAERRSDARYAASEPVKLVGAQNRVFEAEVVDRSLRGLRVRLDQAALLPSDITVLSRASGAAHMAKVVWRSAPYAGLSIHKTVELRTASGPETAALRRLWREHIAA